VIGKARGELIPLRRLDGDADEMSDGALIAACAVDERAALGALFDRHHRVVFGFLARIVPGAASGDIEDLVQSTFIEVWRSARRFRGRAAARSWILGIAANLARHYQRGEARRRVALEKMADCEPKQPSRPDDEAARRELVGRLGDALAELPHELRVAFVMCDLEGVAGVEAARLIGVRKGTMWRRLHEARKALRGALEGRSS
jgi:RNA polymerase sigma factor (sigma-70 family)